MVLKANLVLSARPEPVDETISQKRQLLSATSNSQIAKRASYIQKEEETSNYSSAPEATVVDSLPSPQACSSALRYYSCCKYYKYYYLRCSLPSPSLLFCLLQLQLPQILLLLAKPHSLPSRGLLLWKTVCHLVANAPRSFRLSLLLLLHILQLLLLLLRLLLVMVLLLLKLVGKAPLSFNWWLTGGIQEENREVSDLICGYPKTSKEGQIVSVTTKKYPEFLLNLQFCSFPSFCLSFRNPGNRPLNNVWSLIPIEKNCNLQM